MFDSLYAWSFLTKHIQGIRSGRDYWYVLRIDPDARNAHIESFQSGRDASEAYTEAEKKKVWQATGSISIYQ